MELDHEYLAEYVRRTQSGDSNAFAELYTLTYNKVYNYCRHYLRDDYLAQDAVQEVYISAMKNIEKLNDPTLFVAWINQISLHVCYDICKKNITGYGDIDSELLEEVTDPEDRNNPEGTAIDTDECERLKAAVARLNPTLSHLVTLRYVNNLKIDEIVSMTGISRSTVKRYLQTAISELQKIMKD